jgi:hypothetical protein
MNLIFLIFVDCTFPFQLAVNDECQGKWKDIKQYVRPTQLSLGFAHVEVQLCHSEFPFFFSSKCQGMEIICVHYFETSIRILCNLGIASILLQSKYEHNFQSSSDAQDELDSHVGKNIHWIYF